MPAVFVVELLGVLELSVPFFEFFVLFWKPRIDLLVLLLLLGTGGLAGYFDLQGADLFSAALDGLLQFFFLFLLLLNFLLEVDNFLILLHNFVVELCLLLVAVAVLLLLV